MNEYQKMSLAELKAEIDRRPCAHGKCYTDPRYEYARRHWNGEGINEDKKEAFIYFKEAADWGHERAQYKVGQCYYAGEGIPQDFEKALEYFEKLLRKCWYEQIANLWIGKCYLKLNDKSKGFEYILKAAQESRVSRLQTETQKEAQFLTGLCYFEGVGVDQNYKQAFDYFEKADSEDSGSLGAQYYLAQCYRKGLGTQKNIEMERFYVSKCFEKDYKILIQKAKETLGIN